MSMEHVFEQARDPNAEPDLSVIAPAIEEFRHDHDLDSYRAEDLDLKQVTTLLHQLNEFWERQLRHHDGSLELAEFIQNRIELCAMLLLDLQDLDDTKVTTDDFRSGLSAVLEDVGITGDV